MPDTQKVSTAASVAFRRLLWHVVASPSTISIAPLSLPQPLSLHPAAWHRRAYHRVAQAIITSCNLRSGTGQPGQSELESMQKWLRLSVVGAVKEKCSCYTLGALGRRSAGVNALLLRRVCVFRIFWPEPEAPGAAFHPLCLPRCIF